MNFNFAQPQTSNPVTGSGLRPTAPTFGAPSTASLPTFGAPPAAAAPAFGVQPTLATPSFGASPTAPAATFGAAPTATFGAAPAATFGASPAAPAPAFGAPSTAAAPAFGASTVAPAPTAFGQSFGAPASSAATATVAAPQVQSSLFSSPLGLTKPAATQPSTSTPLFGAPTASSGLFGTVSAAQPTASSGLFSGLAASKPSTQFGATATVPSLSFGAGSTFTPLVSASSVAPGLGGTSVPTSTPSVGLGGVDTTTSSGGLTSLSGLAGSQASRPEAKSPQETPIPDDIAKGVETFRQYVKKQKSFSSEIARCSSKPLLKVQEDTDAMKQVLSSNTAGLQRLKSIADKLKADTAKALQHTEMAQRTHDTPPGLQYDNTAPLQYFAELVAGFERDIKLFRQEIENAERHVHSRVQVTGITPSELTQAMRRLYDSFVALAGRLHSVHSQVKAQKEQYLSLRKYILNDSSDVFDEAARNRVDADLSRGKVNAASRNMVGPTPFSALNAQHGFGLLTAGVAASSRQNFPAVGSLGWSSPANTTGSTTIPLTPHPDSSQFQLQKPPSGNKRGKR